MKKIILSIVIILSFVIFGCNSGSNDPRGVLMNFIDALAKKDITTAKKYATKDSEAMLGMLQMGMSMAPDSLKDKTYDKSNMEFGTATINGDKATVPVRDKKSGETTTYTLKKESSVWKVAFDKATMTEMGKDKLGKMNKGRNNMNEGIDTGQKMMNDLNRMNSDTNK